MKLVLGVVSLITRNPTHETPVLNVHAINAAFPKLQAFCRSQPLNRVQGHNGYAATYRPVAVQTMAMPLERMVAVGSPNPSLPALLLEVMHNTQTNHGYIPKLRNKACPAI